MKKLQEASKESREEWTGKLISYGAIIVTAGIVLAILVFLTIKGSALFVENGVSLKKFLSGQQWSLSHHQFGALPMIVTSLIITLLAGIVALPLAVVLAIAIVEMLPARVDKIGQPIIELLVGIPSVVYGYVGLTVLVPILRTFFGGTGFGILAAGLILFLMVLPTMTSMTIDSLKSVPKQYRQASAGLGATRWQTICRVVIPSARDGILTAMVFGMARAFGEALAVQMVIGNATVMPTSFNQSAATLTSVLTTGIGNTVMGTASNNALWSLALILLIMSLAFNLLIHAIRRTSK